MSEENEPKALPSIRVNVDKWREDRAGGVTPTHTIHLPRIVSDEERENIERQQAVLQDRWLKSQEITVRREKLDSEKVECVECGVTRERYKEDYICFRCRDKLEGTYEEEA